MPRVAIDVDALVEDLFPDLGLAPGSRIRAAALIGAPRIEAQADQIVSRLGFKNNGIDPRFKCVRIFRGQRLFDGFPANSPGVELRNIKMVAEKITGAASVRSASRH